MIETTNKTTAFCESLLANKFARKRKRNEKKQGEISAECEKLDTHPPRDGGRY